MKLRIGTIYEPAGIALGASIACGGACLTVVERGGGIMAAIPADAEPGSPLDKTRPVGRGWFDVEASVETLDKTTLGSWTVGTRINLERALKIGDELGGHIVTGHVDGIATLVARDDVADMARLTFEAPHALSRFIAEKGSVTLDGTSLTVNTVDGDRFSVMLIPHTLTVTTWGDRKPGDRINLEVDTMARYAARLIEAR